MTTRPLKPHAEGADRYWFVSAERYLALLPRLAARLEGLTPRPDSIVGIKRSGLFPAVFLSHRCNLPMFTDGEAKCFPFPEFQRPLIVDTMVWTGKSARRTLGRLTRRGVTEARVLSMFARDDPFPVVDRLHYLELTDRIMHYWYDEEPTDEE